MGSDTRMNKCFVRNTVPNRAGSRKKTRRAHVPREQLSPTLQLETMSLPNSNVRLPVAGPPAAFHKSSSHHSKLCHGTATIGKPFLSSLTKYERFCIPPQAIKTMSRRAADGYKG